MKALNNGGALPVKEDSPEYKIFRYSGSETVPTCQEIMYWHVLKF